MDCSKLNNDIKQLKSLRDELSAKLKNATESGLGKVALATQSSEASDAVDNLLEKYMDDFYEHNPELLSFKVGDLIPGLKGKNGYPAHIESLTTLPDGSVMAGGDGGALYNMTKGPDGNWQVGNLIPGFEDARGDSSVIFSLTTLPDGSVMAGGEGGALYNMTKGPDGNWQVGDLIPGFKDARGDSSVIFSLTTLPDGSVMAGGEGGALYNVSRPEPTLEALKKSLQKIAEKKR